MTERKVDAQDRQIIEHLYAPLRRFAAVVAPAGVEGDDLLQEALVRTLRKRRLNELEYPAAYLRRSIVHLASNTLRFAGTTRRAMARLSASETPGAHDDYPSDLEELMGLPAQEKAVLYLSEVDGYPFAEIGEMLGCTEVAARKRASRARRRLRSAMALEAGS